MRIISQNRAVDLPYEQVALSKGHVYALDEQNVPEKHYCIFARFDGDKVNIAEYTNKVKRDYIFKSIYMAYHEGASVVVIGEESEIEIEEESEVRE